MGRRVTAGIVALGLILFLTSAARADFYGLTNSNTFALFDPNPSSELNEFGMYEWTIDEVEVLHQQWFWYRIGDDPESPVHNLTLSNAAASDTNSDGQNDKLVLLYTNPQISINLEFSLQGGAINSGVAQMVESITISNTAAFSLSLSFFQYSDFDLFEPTGDVAQVLPGGDVVEQTDAAHGSHAKTTVSQTPTHYEVGPYATIFNKLQDASADNLSDNAGPDGPGDETSAFQWDLTLNSGDSFQIDVTKVVTNPEPGTFVLTALSLAGVVFLRRRG